MRRQTSDLSHQTSDVGPPAEPVCRSATPPPSAVRTSVRFRSRAGDRRSRSLILLALLLLLPRAHAAVQMDAAQTNFNHQAIGRTTAEGPAGNTTTSDSGAAPSGSQFQSVLMGGRSFLPKAPEPTNSASANGAAVILTNGSLTMSFARVGSPYILRPTLYAIGSEIPPPDTTEGLESFATGVTAEDYWYPEPVDVGSTYWSPHAVKVYAVRSGTTVVTWRTRAETTSDDPDAVEVGGRHYKAFNQSYLISSSPVKTAQEIYWNTGPYGGPAINLPSSRIGDVRFVYTDNFPEKVAHTLDDLGNVKTDPTTHDADPRLPTNNPEFVRTVWLQSIGPLSSILAQNVEGRIFMEILGDVVGNDGTQDVREHLGFEVLNVVKYPNPTDLTVELGEPIVSTTGDSSLLPQPQDQASSVEFLHQRTVEGVEIPTYYAIKETINRNDLLVHWLIEGVEGIRWPSEFIRYTAAWPDDVSKYSHYARPLVSTEAKAEATAVPLNSLDIPEIVYQDVFDDLAAHLTGDSRFYTFLTADHPVHRTLLRYSSGDNVAFERVFSWLDSELLVSDSAIGDGAINTTLVSDGSLLRRSESGASEISSGFAFNSQSFTIEGQVRLETRGDFDRFMQLGIRKSDGSLATVELGLNISSAQPYPYIDVYGEDLGDPLTANLNGDSSSGGLRYRADIMPVKTGHTDLTDWRAITIGGEQSSIGVNNSPEHFGILFRGNGQIELWDGNANVTDDVTDAEAIYYSANADQDGIFHRIDLLATGSDGNPFDGSGNTQIDVYSALSPTAFVSYSKNDPGYADNYSHSHQTGGSGETRNLRVTRISDGAAFAVATTAMPLEQSVHVAMVGDGDRCRIYLDGVLVGEGPNLVGVSGTVETVSVGSDGTGSATDATFESIRIWENEVQSNLPRLVKGTVEVGKRIVAPAGENGSGAGEDYLAGHINQAVGTSFNPDAYVDPINADNELATANLGAIIPVNAIPGADELEVLWLRPNGADTAAGFHTTYWPAIIGRYTIEWPADPPEIVLASDDGSGKLDSLPATGDIYYQNDPTLPGYNPNEEHAIMSGGQAFALRDDLNLTGTTTPAILTGTTATYSSDPFVLLEYIESDGRPAMIAFKVLREKPEAGVTFEYGIAAGSVLQGPMPLILLSGVNEEPIPPLVVGSSFDSTSLESVLTVSERPEVEPFEGYLLQGGLTDEVEGFYVSAVNHDTKQVAGYVTIGGVHEIEHRQFAAWRMNQHSANPVVRVEVFNGSDIPAELVEAGDKVLLISPAEGRAEVFDLIDTADNRLFVSLTNASASAQDVGGFETATQFVFLKKDLAGNAFASTDAVSWLLTSTVAVDPASAAAYSRYTLTDRKGDRWVYRGPHDASDGDRFRVQYHYETLDGFYFPGESTQPAVGTRTPYLRSYDTNAAAFVGGAYDGAADAVSALSITYIPTWPTDAPELHRGETLTLTRRTLPAMRGNSSLEIVYDQALATSDLATKSVILHDPTREKEHELGTTNTVDGIDYVLAELPASIATSTYNGDTFFPNLPPHLSDRFLLDPNRGSSGALVFKGQFFEETLGEDYVMLNVAGAKDLETLYGLCDSADENYQTWTNAINSLKAVGEVYIEDPAVSGTFIASSTVQAKLDAGEYVNDPDAAKTQTRDLAETRLAAVQDRYRTDGLVSGFTGYIGDLMEVTDDDVAVDSYALTATGPGTGYVSVLAGNGEAFTQTDDPVSILILKVVDTWHPGEIKVVLSSNPLSEKVTVQQVVDLAGEARDVDTSDKPLFAFDWRLAAPVDGLAPDVFNYQVATLWNNGSWTHIPLPTHSDTVSGIATTATERTTTVSGSAAAVTVLESITLSSEATTTTADGFQITVDNRIANFAQGNLLEVTDSTGAIVVYSVTNDSSTGVIDVELSAGDNPVIDVASVVEAREADIPQSYLYSEFEAPEVYSELWFSLNLGADLGARVYVNGTEVIVAGLNDVDTNITDTVSATPPDGLDPDFSPVGTTYLVSRDVLTTDGTPNQVVVALFTTEDAVVGASETFQLKIEALEYVDLAAGSTSWLAMGANQFLDGIRAIIGGTADVQSLSDQHVIMRYGPANAAYDEATDSITNAATEWSEWTEPQLVEGWIKRVLAGINPFNQRTSDLFNNAVDTDSSMLTLAGARWEGDVALNSDTINDYGLIEIYETVLNRGKGLSIDSGINYGPANDALLLAAGYINDLYTFLGNEALSDALNPTIGIGTSNGELGDVATSLFAFKGQTATLLEEELALLRGRDDFLPPGVEATPVYNRLFWNYTRGIDSGEVVYALNYNIQEEKGDVIDGVVGAEDAAVFYPQGHGDAYGHFLTGLKNYYALIIDEDFDWVPRTEGVLILNQTVQVDYTDERKFAAAAAAVARTGRQVFDLTWRQDFQSGDDVGWEHFGADATRSNDKRLTTRFWGVDHWASRAGQGAFINWIAGNAMLPEIDDDPDHEGIQVIDRTTVPELTEIADISRDLQTSMDNADAHLNPLGMSSRSMAFDVNPTTYSFWQGGNSSHFEQIYERAKVALNNAVTAFDDAKDVTRLMRGELNDLAGLKDRVLSQELAYTNALIELYGTPYTDDIGVGETYDTGYAGPDLTHYNYIDISELDFGDVLNPANPREFTLSSNAVDVSFYSASDIDLERSAGLIAGADQSFTFTLGTHGFFSKPSDWTGKRESPGEIQLAIADIVKARNGAFAALQEHELLKYRLDREADMALARLDTRETEILLEGLIAAIRNGQDISQAVYQTLNDTLDRAQAIIDKAKEQSKVSVPDSFIVGFATGGDTYSTVKAAITLVANAQIAGIRSAKSTLLKIWLVEHVANEAAIRGIDIGELLPTRLKQQKLEWLHDVDLALRDLQRSAPAVNAAMQEYGDAQSRYNALVAKGDRLQAEREIFRQQLAADVQGFRTRDAGFRFFRDEKLERYEALFNLAARYAFIAAQAYDYETGLLGTDEGKSFIDRIVGSRALGVIKDGEPQFAGSNTGDPGLSSTLAEMAADFQVLKGRLGLNNPDVYGTTVSLRTENFRIYPGSDGDTNWRDVLEASRQSNLLEDEDVVRHCLQINNGTGLQVPGLVIEFSTEITEGNNLFGQPLAGGDHAFDISSFATKIFSVGVVLEGYNGMDNPSANASATDGSSTADPTAVFLEPTALSATPYVYLIPVGVDAMRSPALGDQSVIRTWSVDDVTIPLPFNIGASDFSSKLLYQSADSLPEDLFSVRKHQAFRPVSDSSVFGENGQLLPSEYVNNRLVGRSVWNTKWKLVIPGRTLLNDPEQGLDVLMDTLSDIKLRFQTYSYSGN